jgi:Flp pilus assembly protein TadD
MNSYHRSSIAIALGYTLLFGCAPKRDIEPIARWRTEAGAHQVRLDLADALLDRGNVTEALHLLTRLRQDGEDGPELDLLQGRALAQQALWNPAEELILAAKKRLPKDPRPPHALAVIYAEQGRLEDSISWFKQANQYAPRNPEILNNLGYVQLAVGLCSEAIISLQAAIKLDGTQVMYRNNLAFSHICSDEMDTAMSLFRSTTSEAEARYNVGVGYELQNNREVAMEQYQLALEDNPYHRLAKDALQRLGTPTHEQPSLEEEL